MPFATLPDPAQADHIDDLVERLRLLKIWAGDPSYETIKDRVNAAWTASGRPAAELARRSTVANCFQSGRRRLNTDLVLAVVEALHPDVGYVTQWRQALRVVAGESEAVSQVRVHDKLPQDLVGFTGRTTELDRLALSVAGGGAVVITAIEGMAGVGKTQLAVHAGHLLGRDEPFDRVLFVNLRGFHPDPMQPPADPAAVLDGFLRLLGVPGHQIPHGVDARTAAYRERLAGLRALVVLDNAAGTDQVRPLLPDTPGCLALVTSRRNLAELAATRLTVDVFSPDEALAFLTGAVPEIATGTDPGAAARIAERCGYLPLALSLITGHMRSTPGWTLTDHADRLDERHRDRRLDSGIELALDLSYQHLPADQQRLLRLAALHPGPDVDAYAAAALLGTGLDTARAGLEQLWRDHLLLPAGPGRYTFHDLVRAFATTRAHDQDRPADRRAALTRLFDHYLSTAAAAMDTLHPAEAYRRPRVPPAGSPAPDLSDPDDAVAWLDGERPTMLAVAGHDSAAHAVGLSRVLSRYLGSGHNADAMAIHGHALEAARRIGDATAQAHALRDLGFAHFQMGRVRRAAEYSEQSLTLFRQAGDRSGQGTALHNLGMVAERSGRSEEAVGYLRQALAMYRQAGDRVGESNTLSGLGITLERAGRVAEAIDYCEQALDLAVQTRNTNSEAYALGVLADAELRAGRYEPAGGHLRRALALQRSLGDRIGEAGVLDSLGTLHTRLGEPDDAVGYHEQALVIARESGDQEGVAWVLNSLGEAAHAAGRAEDARRCFTEAATVAGDIGFRDQQARAGAGLGHVHRALGDEATAREHFERALALYADLGAPEAEEVRAALG
ncbi:ATP-binding protein [Paractinoplanes rishiriensis]|uniref:NB-ARC domain-containing protein n=1 Tax=Paractinoplanes rishiriensis TaxID=1050105 RepID=A0A919MNR0_9ACTN|nr:tetratricopeptide repeat protein [Actinoplanes rishiriensis]GIE94296.1 hypothetical protein Ari01nite_17610 [Actinoplanes rishiriensis]